MFVALVLANNLYRYREPKTGQWMTVELYQQRYMRDVARTRAMCDADQVFEGEHPAFLAPLPQVKHHRHGQREPQRVTGTVHGDGPS